MSYLKINSSKERDQIVADYKRQRQRTLGFETQRHSQEPYKSSKKEKRDFIRNTI